MKCPKCQGIVFLNSKHCHECGYKLKEEDILKEARKRNTGIAIELIIFVCIFIIIMVGFIANSAGYNEGYAYGKNAGYSTGYSSGQSYGTSYGMNQATACLNSCNSGTGIVNECYSLNCIRQCFGNIR